MGSALIIAAGLGAAVAIQIGILGRMAGRFNILTVSMVLQMSGLAAGATWTAIRSGWAEAGQITRLWWWIPLGIFGWVLVAGLGHASARIGVSTTLAVSVASQLAVGLAIDANSGSRVGVGGVLGLLLLVGGTVLITTRA